MKTTKVLSMLLSFVLLLSALPMNVWAESAITTQSITHEAEQTTPVVEAVNPWDGTADTSWYNETDTLFYLGTAQQLAGLSELNRAGNSFAGKTVCLANDIFMNDQSYSFDWPGIPYWEGTFNGNGHAIYNIYQNDDGSGFFHTIGPSGIVKAVDFVQGLFMQGGCVADVNQGIIAFCNNYSTVYGDQYSNRIGNGAICDDNQNFVYGCGHYGTMICNDGFCVGGIVGNNSQTLAVVSQCHNLGLIQSNHAMGGIVGFNNGWVYNCFSGGTFQSDATHRTIAGIVANNSADSYMIESCYSISEDLSYAIAPDGSVNCYSLYGGTQDEEFVTVLTKEQMQDPSFVNLLNIQTHTVFPAWMPDTNMSNGGFPITVADYHAERGIYKVQPELWIMANESVSMGHDETKRIACEVYYTDSPAVITLSDSSIAECTLSDDRLIINPLKAGETLLNIHFDETENAIAADYTLMINVHQYRFDSILKPTCTESGYFIYVCEHCGDVRQEYDTSALGHNKKTVTVPATCTEDGITSVICTVCNEIFSQSIIPAVGHEIVMHEPQAPTCTENGWDSFESCTRCDYSTQTVIPATGHQYSGESCLTCGQLKFVYGDINGDGKITGTDVTRLLRYIANRDPFTGVSSVEITEGADCNGDGKITGTDITRLLRYLANRNPVTGESDVVLGK